MSTIVPVIPEMEVGLIVVTPVECDNLTVNKLYIIEKINNNNIYIKDDLGKVGVYSAYQFMEANLYFTICLYSTVIIMFNLGNKSYK